MMGFTPLDAETLETVAAENKKYSYVLFSLAAKIRKLLPEGFKIVRVA
jgi:hypothetical protein